MRIRKEGRSRSFFRAMEALLLVLSILMCSLGFFAGVGNVATMTFIALTPKLRQATFGKLLFNLAVSGKFYTLVLLLHQIGTICWGPPSRIHNTPQRKEKSEGKIWVGGATEGFSWWIFLEFCREYNVFSQNILSIFILEWSTQPPNIHPYRGGMHTYREMYTTLTSTVAPLK